MQTKNTAVIFHPPSNLKKNDDSVEICVRCYGTQCTEWTKKLDHFHKSVTRVHDDTKKGDLYNQNVQYIIWNKTDNDNNNNNNELPLL